MELFTGMKPDFAALSKIDFSKPQIQKDNKMWLALAGCAVAALIFCFFPAWLKYDLSSGSDKVYNAFGAWYGIIAFLGVLVAVASVLYGQYKLAFWAGLVIAVMALLGCFMSPDADEMEQAKDADIAVKRWGAYLSVIAGAGIAYLSYKFVKK
jgi:membrane associated rhomboid family serine protease